MNSTVRTILFWLLMILVAVVLWKMASTGGQSVYEDEPNYTNFLAKVQGGNVKDVTIYLSPNSAELQGEYRDGSKCHVAAFAEEFHHFVASPCHLCPTGFRIGVLFESTT